MSTSIFNVENAIRVTAAARESHLDKLDPVTARVVDVFRERYFGCKTEPLIALMAAYLGCDRSVLEQVIPPPVGSVIFYWGTVYLVRHSQLESGTICVVDKFGSPTIRNGKRFSIKDFTIEYATDDQIIEFFN